MNECELRSVCKTRTLLNLKCKGCKGRRDCIKFKYRHNGLSPYEVAKIKAKKDSDASGD